MTRALVQFTLLPFVGYLACFFVLTFPLVIRFTDAYYCDDGDGPAMIWGVWWVRHAIVDLHQSPYHATHLHHPHGATLLLHTLTPMKGLISIPLWAVIASPMIVYNTLVVLSFALSGLGAFWLAHYVTRSYWPTLAAGYAFAFCAFRFAHAPGHLHVISTEWMPLFLLLLLMTLRQPGALRAVATALTLLFVLLCDHYQFLLCMLAATIMSAWHLWRWRGLGPWRSRNGLRAALAALLTASVTTAPLVIAMLRAATREHVWGAHIPTWYSADLLGPFVPGWVWQYNALTAPIWRPVGNYTETSVSIGIAILVAAIYGFLKRRAIAFDSATLWLAIAITCIALSLGPTITIVGIPLTSWTPYRLAETLLPPLRLGGCPARIMIMAQLACAVLAAAGLKALALQHHLPCAVLVGTVATFVVLMVLESQPRVLPTFDPRVPQWVHVVRDAPQPGAVFDAHRWGDAIGMYYQTIHRRAIIWGELSRTPASIERATRRLVRDARDRDARFLADRGFRFVVTSVAAPMLPLPLIHEDRTARLYRLDPTNPSLTGLRLPLPTPTRRAVHSFHGFDEFIEQDAK